MNSSKVTQGEREVGHSIACRQPGGEYGQLYILPQHQKSQSIKTELEKITPSSLNRGRGHTPSLEAQTRVTDWKNILNIEGHWDICEYDILVEYLQAR